MPDDLLATSIITVDAPPEKVWKALTDPAIVEKYYFGTHLETDWKVGSPIVWRGEYEGKQYEDHGTVLEVKENEKISNTHFSPLTGKQDVPENYHTLTYLLEPAGAGTTLTLTQDNNENYDAVKHNQANWDQMLEGLKKVVET